MSNGKMNGILKIFFILSGTFFLAIGIIGLVLPILPTTPFLLLAAFFYSRSSKRYYDWLMSNRIFGRYLKTYRDGGGIPLKGKIFTISLLWVTITISSVTVANSFAVQIILMLVAIGVTIDIIRIKTVKNDTMPYIYSNVPP